MGGGGFYALAFHQCMYAPNIIVRFRNHPDTLVQASFSYPACGATEILYITVVLPESDVIFETLQ